MLCRSMCYLWITSGVAPRTGHNQTAKPLTWTWTRDKLNAYLKRLGRFNPTQAA
jgi:hypothetical protein